jgi:hypothetical protein
VDDAELAEEDDADESPPDFEDDADEDDPDEDDDESDDEADEEAGEADDEPLPSDEDEAFDDPPLRLSVR